MSRINQPNNPSSSTEVTRDPIDHNIESVLAFYLREEKKISRWQKFIEIVSDYVGRPFYLGFLLLLICLWIFANVFATHFGWVAFDPMPFGFLQGVIGIVGLLTSTVVLIKQNRLSGIEDRRTHLELQVNLLAEQKITKIISLIEELRRDLPNVKDRHDPETATMQRPTDPATVLAALEEILDAEDRTSVEKKGAEK